MKKKMAILGTLLVAVIGTGFSVSGTYAKYISEVSLESEARVAKWQIGLGDGISETLDLFHSSYDFAANGTVVKALSRDLTKKDGEAASTMDNVIAPGTKGQYTFALEGILETAYTINVDTTGSANGVTTTYPVIENVGGVDTTTTKTYDPVKYFLSTDANLTTDNITGWYSFDDLVKELNKLYKEADGTTLTVHDPAEMAATDNTYTIYWKWDFEQETTDEEKKLFNSLDTKLGNEIAKTPTSHVVTLKINITAEQVGGNHAEKTPDAVTPTPGA